jgi:hypothetical protein
MIDTPEKLGLLLRKEKIPEKNRYASYLCKAYYDQVQELKKFYGFSYAQILKSVNSALELCQDNSIKYEAFRSSLRRIERIRDGNTKQTAKPARPQDNEFRAHEKEFIKEHKATATVDSEETLPDAWEEILNRHPTIKAISLHKAIDSGLPIEKAQEASKEGTKQLLEVLNKYRNKTFR